jgi:glutathione synthase
MGDLPFQLQHFEQAKYLQPFFNSLVAKLNESKDFLLSICRDACQSDAEFSGCFLHIAETVEDRSGFIMNLLRSDYMVDEAHDKLIQVELNTTCCAFGGQSDKLSKYYRDCGLSVPENNFIEVTTDSFIKAHQLWCKQFNVEAAAIALVVQPNERNYYDQQLLLSAFSARGVRVKRVHLDDCFELCEDALLHHETDVLSIVYFRAGYSPDHYSGEKTWYNRELIESSRAIKVPNILSTLAGLKVVQQSLSDGDFICKVGLKCLQTTFAEQYSLGLEFSKCLEALKRDPFDYVLKPQREGGGNNIYKEAVLPFAESLKENQRSGYILMRLIKSRVLNNVKVLKEGNPAIIEHAVQELGIFGVYLVETSKPDNPIINTTAGWLMRTKDANCLEGSVSLGMAYLDGVVLSE